MAKGKLKKGQKPRDKRLCPPGKVLKEGKCVSNKLKKGQPPRRHPMEMELPKDAVPAIPFPKMKRPKKKYL